jgi:hypothetical protein
VTRLIWKFLSACVICMACGASIAAGSPIPVEQRRSIEQTFLTFPEWYLVHSPAEFATLVADRPSHDFPFIGHVAQLWSSYAAVTTEQVRAKYPANLGYHVMICVIAVSTTVEYTLRWIYENTFGRVSWAASSGKLTDEDRYGATVAQDYVDFIRKEPWYLYDFLSKLKGLWADSPAWNTDLVRSLERRYALTSEYLIKAMYAKMIEAATRSAYEPALMTTKVVVDRKPDSLPNGANITLVHELPDGSAIMDLPRYYNFRVAATQLAQGGSKLKDIAGNNTVILVTVWAPEAIPVQTGSSRVLFEQRLITMPGRKRVALIVPVPELSDFLLHAAQQGLPVEHVYDY